MFKQFIWVHAYLFTFVKVGFEAISDDLYAEHNAMVGCTDWVLLSDHRHLKQMIRTNLFQFKKLLCDFS